MKKILFITIIFFITVITVIFVKKSPVSNQQSIKVGDKTLKVEKADTSEKREKGLSGRESLCTNCGLLFIFDKEGIYPFWMKEMKFNIDIIWISGDKIIDISSNAQVPPKEEMLSPKTFYQSNSLIDKVLEVNAGWCEKNGIRAGDIIVLGISL